MGTYEIPNTFAPGSEFAALGVAVYTAEFDLINQLVPLERAPEIDWRALLTPQQMADDFFAANPSTNRVHVQGKTFTRG